jgi:glycosyltransferase involved in cell wall biosynthesis
MELLERRRALGLEQEVVFLALEGRLGERLDVSDALMTELYWWADALLVTSVQEGFGLPILEAGLVRLPIFCTDITALKEVGREHATYFRPTDDPNAIADVMLGELQKPGVAAMRRKIVKTYTWDNLFHSRILPLLQD